MTFDSTAFTKMIGQEATTLGAFIEMLRVEQTALLQGETDKVAALAQAKSQHAFELARLGDIRGRWLASCCPGYTRGADRAAFERRLHELSGGGAAPRDAWRQLMQLAESARHINSTNGMLIAARLQNAQRALGALFSAARLPGAYSADGSTVSLRTAQHLASA